MQIESIIKRPRGTFVNIEGTRYAFVPETEGGPHVAEVENPRHIERFLSITEGYRVFVSDDTTPATTPAPQEPVVQEPVVQKAATDDQTPANTATVNIPDIPLDQMTLTDLQAVYRAELEKSPHPRTGIPRLIEEIEAHRAAQAQE